MNIQEVIDFVEKRFKEYDEQFELGLKDKRIDQYDLGKKSGKSIATLDILSYLKQQQKGNN